MKNVKELAVMIFTASFLTLSLTACFGGGYPTALPEPGGKDRFECPISEREEA